MSAVRAARSVKGRQRGDRFVIPFLFCCWDAPINVAFVHGDL